MNAAKYLRLLLLITATLPFWGMGHPLWEVDDARYAEVPREMAESGDWITPKLDYIDYVQKPPLIYWLTAASYKVFGVSEASSRLPLALLSLLGIFGVVWLGSWLFSMESGLWGGILLGSCAEYSLLSHLHTPDLALTVFLFWTSALILRALHRPEDAWWAGPAAGLAMGLAFLSKGLVAWIFPALWTGAVLFSIPNLRKNVRLHSIAGACAAVALVVVPWLWAMSARHPRFLHHFFIEQHFLRYLTPEYNRPGPWYYFLGVDAGGLLPWTPVVFAAIAMAAKNWKSAGPGERELLLWTGLVFLFFTASKSKLPTYILPIFPQQCLLGANLITRLNSGKEKLPFLDKIHLGLGGLLLTAIPVGVYLSFQVPSKGLPIDSTLRVLGSVLLAGIAASWMIPKLLPWAAFLLTEILLLGAIHAEPWISTRSLSRQIISHCEPGSDLWTYNIYLHGLPFYTKRRVDKVVNWLGELAYGKADPKFRDRFGNDEDIRALGKGESKTCVALPKSELRYFETLLPPSLNRTRITQGPWVLVVLEKKGNQPDRTTSNSRTR